MRIIAICLALVVAGCGVRGDPIPPGTPAELGRGKPNYKRATEDLTFPATPPTPSPDDEDSESDD